MNMIQVAKLHDEAKRRGMANVVTYSAAIAACAKEKRWKNALRLLSEMRRDVSDITPTYLHVLCSSGTFLRR